MGQAHIVLGLFPDSRQTNTVEVPTRHEPRPRRRRHGGMFIFVDFHVPCSTSRRDALQYLHVFRRSPRSSIRTDSSRGQSCLGRGRLVGQPPGRPRAIAARRSASAPSATPVAPVAPPWHQCLRCSNPPLHDGGGSRGASATGPSRSPSYFFHAKPDEASEGKADCWPLSKIIIPELLPVKRRNPQIRSPYACGERPGGPE